VSTFVIELSKNGATKYRKEANFEKMMITTQTQPSSRATDYCTWKQLKIKNALETSERGKAQLCRRQVTLEVSS